MLRCQPMGSRQASTTARSTTQQQNLGDQLMQDGAVWPVRVLSAAEAALLGSRLLRETSSQTDFTRSDLLYYKSHLVFSTVDLLARHPAIVQAAQAALGGANDLLLWDSSVPIKPPATDQKTTDDHFPWHQVRCPVLGLVMTIMYRVYVASMHGRAQDGTYWGLRPMDGAVSCWVALTDASEASGCM